MTGRRRVLRWAPLAAILLLALALRLYGLDRAPPGLFYDEAANQIDAIDLLEGGRPRVFFTGNQGREPLQIYAIAVATWLLGPGWLAARLPSVLVGTATVAVAYLLGAQVGGRRVGLLTALLLATSYWHVSLSRLGFRAVWVPLLAGLALALALRARRGGSPWPAVASGLALGLGFYSYIAARLLPALVLVASPPRRLPLTFGVAAATALPLVAYFWRHPEDFWTRVQNASGGPAATGTRIANAVGLYVWQGDAAARHNLPERAVFDPLTGALFLIGLAVCLRRWRDPGHRVVLAACGLMLLPQALAEGEPHFLRAVGVLPAAAVAAAVGLEVVLVGLPWRVATAAVVALAAGWVGLAARDYFVLWSPSHATFEAFEGEGRAAASLLRELPAGEAVAAGSRIYAERATFYLGERRQPEVPFDSRHALALPAAGSAAIVPRPVDVPSDLRERLGAPEVATGPWLDEDGSPAAVLYRLDPRAFALPRPLLAVVGRVAQIEGYDLRTAVAPGGQQRLLLTWRPLGPATAGLYQFAHVVGPAPGGGERSWAVDDVVGVPSRSWRGGERVLSWFDLSLPGGAPTSALWIETGFYETPGLRRLPVTDPRGAPLGDRLLLGPFKVWDGRLAGPAPASPLATFAGDLRLASVQLPTSVRPGQPVPLRAVWWAAGPTAARLTVFAHLLEEGRQERAGADGPPAAGNNPTDLWQPGEHVVDERTFRPPADLLPGRYAVEYGLYDPATGSRLPLVSAPERLGDAAIVGWVDVR